MKYDYSTKIDMAGNYVVRAEVGDLATEFFEFKEEPTQQQVTDAVDKFLVDREVILGE